MSLSKSQAGVTIMELMMATVSFSVILLIVMSAYLYMAKAYQKGYYESQTQSVTRSLAQQISQEIELSAGKVTTNNPLTGAYQLKTSGTSQGICVGDYRYSFALNAEINGTSVKDALVVDNLPNCTAYTPGSACVAAGTCVAQDVATGVLTPTSKELLGKNMRLGAFQIVAPPDSSLPGSTIPAVPGLYAIKLTVGYGDDTGTGGPLNVSGPVNNSYSYTCNEIKSGGSFCAVSSLNTYAQQRLSNQTQ